MWLVDWMGVRLVDWIGVSFELVCLKQSKEFLDSGHFVCCMLLLVLWSLLLLGLLLLRL